jgi:phosphate/sulfate permease
MKFKKLKAKVRDFKTYGAILTALSSFFYIGTLLPKDGVTTQKVEIMEFIVFAMLIAAFGFFMLSNHFNRKLQNEEQM